MRSVCPTSSGQAQGCARNAREDQCTLAGGTTSFPERCAAIVLDSTSSEVNAASAENWCMRGEVARLGFETALGGRDLAPAFASRRRARRAHRRDRWMESLTVVDMANIWGQELA
jgi:hypothetical protein